MKSNFNDCLSRLLKDEGGYTNDPNDSGGPTNFGITLTDYRKYINKDGVAADVKKMKVDDASTIYRDKYWNALGCDGLPSGVDYSVFDYGVNSGLGRPRKALQRFKSLKGTDLITAVNNERTAFLQALATSSPKDQKFLRGWLARVQRVDAYSKVLAGKKDITSGPSTAVGISAIGYAIAHFWHEHTWLILGSAAGLALFVGLTVHYLTNKVNK